MRLAKRARAWRAQHEGSWSWWSRLPVRTAGYPGESCIAIRSWSKCALCLGSQICLDGALPGVRTVLCNALVQLLQVLCDVPKPGEAREEREVVEMQQQKKTFLPLSWNQSVHPNHLPGAHRLQHLVTRCCVDQMCHTHNTKCRKIVHFFPSILLPFFPPFRFVVTLHLPTDARVHPERMVWLNIP